MFKGCAWICGLLGLHLQVRQERRVARLARHHAHLLLRGGIVQDGAERVFERGVCDHRHFPADQRLYAAASVLGHAHVHAAESDPGTPDKEPELAARKPKVYRGIPALHHGDAAVLPARFDGDVAVLRGLLLRLLAGVDLVKFAVHLDAVWPFLVLNLAG